jgi:HEAT repeat protein
VSHTIVERLRHADPEERRAACLAARDDPAAAVLADALGHALGDPVKAVARAASDALVEIGRRERHVDSVLRDALRSDSPRRRFTAAYTSVRLHPPTPGLLPALLEALGSADGDVRWAAARILVDLGRLHGEVLGVLVGLLRGGEDPVVRRMAAFCLRELAPDRPESASVLLAATRDPDLHVRRAALSALAGLLDPPPEVCERLLEALMKDEDPAAKRIAAVALGELGAGSPTYLPAGASERLRALAAEAPEPDLRRAAERALARLERRIPHAPQEEK